MDVLDIRGLGFAQSEKARDFTREGGNTERHKRSAVRHRVACDS